LRESNWIREDLKVKMLLYETHFFLNITINKDIQVFKEYKDSLVYPFPLTFPTLFTTQAII